MPNELPELLNRQQVIDYLKIGHETYFKLVREDPDFITCKIGKQRYMDMKDLNAWIQKQKGQSK